MKKQKIIVKFLVIFTRTLRLIKNGLLKTPTKKEAELIKQLRENINSFGIKDNTKVDAKKWVNNEEELKDCIRENDPRKFLTWDIIRREMFVGNAMYIKKELKYIKDNSWNKWKEIIEETKIGYPMPSVFHLQSSGNCIHQAYHLQKFEELTKQDISKAEYIIEFGGGYGNFCKLIHKCGFKGKYYIFDIPTCSALQHYYLSSSGYESSLGLDESKNINCIHKIEDFKNVIEKSKGKKSALIGTWSISESPREVREVLLDPENTFKSYLIAYQSKFSNIDNTNFFKQLSDNAKDVNWIEKRISHFSTSKYLFGATKN